MEFSPCYFFQVHSLAVVCAPPRFDSVSANKIFRISIPLIWAIASKTELLNGDPMLWFSMMLMPTGPPAMILVALTDVTGAPEAMKMTIAKFLTVRFHLNSCVRTRIYVNTGQLCYNTDDMLRRGRSIKGYRSCH